MEAYFIVGFSAAVIGGLLWYLYDLQRRYFEVCRDQKQITLFAQSPLGLPEGSVRSVLALAIVLVGLSLIAVSAYQGAGHEVPQALTAVLSMVLGFYFGSRGSATHEEGSEQVKTLQTQLNESKDEKHAAEADTLMSKIAKGIDLTKTVAAVLSPELGGKAGDLVSKMEAGLSAVRDLSSGDPAKAVAKATEVFALFKQDNPVRGIVEKALQTFGPVLSSSVPPLAVITALVGISAALTDAYQKWKARILYLPFSPAVIPLQVVDATIGFALLTQSPTFKKAFKKQLEDNDRPFMEQAVVDFLREERMDVLWEKYKANFESRQEFETGLEEFRRATATKELRESIDPALLSGLPGGVDALMTAVDTIHANDAASADLDTLFETIDGIKQKGESPKNVFDKVLAEVKP